MAVNGRLIIYGLVFVLHLVICTDNNEAHKKRLYDCFNNQNERTCEDTRIKIDGQFYECDAMIVLDSPPKRIVYRGEDTFFSSGSDTYRINNETGAQKVLRTIPPSGEVSDNNGNVYFGEGGMSFVIEKSSGKEIKIVTNDYNSYSQYAIDKKSNKLFILSFFSDADPLEKTGQLFILSTDPLYVVDGMIKADIVKIVGEQITALAVDTEQQYLTLGIKEANGGKLIRLKRKAFDPCSKKTSNKLAIAEVISEMQNKIFQLIDQSPEIGLKANFLAETSDDGVSKSLSRENQRLKRELQLTTEKLQIFSLKMIGFSNKLHRPQGIPQGIPQSRPQGRPPAGGFSGGFSGPDTPVDLIMSGMDVLQTTQTPEEEFNSYFYDENNSPDIHTCIRISRALNRKVLNLNRREKDTQQKFEELLKQFNQVVAENITDTPE